LKRGWFSNLLRLVVLVVVSSMVMVVLVKRGWWVIAFGGMGRMLYRDGCEDAAAYSGVISISVFIS
jgi:hypothetical protein